MDKPDNTAKSPSFSGRVSFRRRQHIQPVYVARAGRPCTPNIELIIERNYLYPSNPIQAAEGGNACQSALAAKTCF
jgi:hypothetical protein